MTQFEKDYNEMLKGPEQYILENRMREINRLKNEQQTCKNHFRFQCICQTLDRLEEEYELLEELY